MGSIFGGYDSNMHLYCYLPPSKKKKKTELHNPFQNPKQFTDHVGLYIIVIVQ